MPAVLICLGSTRTPQKRMRVKQNYESNIFLLENSFREHAESPLYNIKESDWNFSLDWEDVYGQQKGPAASKNGPYKDMEA